MSNNQEVIDTKDRERRNIVKWMREVLAEKPDDAARKAFMAKMYSICKYHNITLEELLKSGK